MLRDEHIGTIVALMGGALLSGLLGGIFLMDYRWKRDAVIHNAAQYIIKDGAPVWKWRDQVPSEGT